VQSDDDRAIVTTSERTGKPLAEVKEWFNGQKLRDTDFAQRNGIITAVEPLQMSSQAAFFQVMVLADHGTRQEPSLIRRPLPRRPWPCAAVP